MEAAPTSTPAAPAPSTDIALGAHVPSYKLPPELAAAARQPPATAGQPPAAAWPRSAQAAAALLLGLAAVLLAVHYQGALRDGRPADLERGGGLKYRVDLNRATRA